MEQDTDRSDEVIEGGQAELTDDELESVSGGGGNKGGGNLTGGGGTNTGGNPPT